ncbi:MAG: hypothetical protein CTY31_08080 [Hyphomicrobium sp.]|nr:MAG: hypothetical protein CTY39_02445 [Hyphomicrobium sp.]PPC99845.1 MAG: hypothetical protein CTY31_08080 [Hyphomicrobium sp.]
MSENPRLIVVLAIMGVLFAATIGAWQKMDANQSGGVYGIFLVSFVGGLVLLGYACLIAFVGADWYRQWSGSSPNSSGGAPNIERLTFADRRQRLEAKAAGSDGTLVIHEFSQASMDSITIPYGESSCVVRISQATRDRVWIYGDHPSIAYYSISPIVERGAIVDVSKLRKEREVICPTINDRVIITAADGAIIQLLITMIRFRQGGDETDEVRLRYRIYKAGEHLVAAL